MKYAVFVFFQVVAFCLPLLAHATEIEVVTEDWQPYNFSRNGRVVGISTEIVEQSLQRAGMTIRGGTIQLMPWARAYYIVRHRPNTLIYTILRTPERENLFKWVGPLTAPDAFYLYKLAARKDIRVASLKAARRYRIGILKDSVHGQFLRAHGFRQEQLESVSYQPLNMRKLLGGRVDLIIDVDKTLRGRAEEMGIPFTVFEKVLFLFRRDYYMAFNHATPDSVVRRVGAALQELRSDGTISRIVGRYEQEGTREKSRW